MADNALAKLLETQISLSEWLKNAGHQDAAALQAEDNVKRERIGQVNDIIGLPYDKPSSFEATELRDRSLDLQKFLKEHGGELCALRLIPKASAPSDAPKLRMRGKTVQDVMTWFDEQTLKAEDYTADFVPHPPDYSWATIFVVNDHGVFGEIYYGAHSVLTQGFHELAGPLTFSFDFSTWVIEPHNAKALSYLKDLVETIHVKDTAKRKQLKQEVKADFAHDYIKGYFETTHSRAVGTWFIDYNRLLGKRYSDFVVNTTTNIATGPPGLLLQGRSGSPGQAMGMIRVVHDSQQTEFAPGEILVCSMTSPDYLSLMQKANAIITDQGGVLCHAAIVARELGIPCIVGTGNATQILKNGQKVRIDATNGYVFDKGDF